MNHSELSKRKCSTSLGGEEVSSRREHGHSDLQLQVLCTMQKTRIMLQERFDTEKTHLVALMILPLSSILDKQKIDTTLFNSIVNTNSQIA